MMEVLDLFNQAEIDMYVHPCIVISDGEKEGIPVSFMEAMASRIPVISPSTESIPELVKDGETGILIPPQGTQALVQAILKLATNPELGEQMGQTGQKQAQEQFDIARTAREYESLYLELLEKKGKR